MALHSRRIPTVDTAPAILHPSLNANALCSVPLNTAVTEESFQEAQMLSALHALFGEAEGVISPRHYDMPVLMTGARGEVLEHLLEAWVMSGLFYNYNIVLSGEPEKMKALQQQVFSQTCFRLYPQAIEHVAFYTGDVLRLQGALVRYLSNQEPHLYFCAETEDALCRQAVAQGFLVFSLTAFSWLRHQDNGFLLSAGNARHLALQLIQILENPDYDWESLQYIAQRAQKSLIAV